MHLKVFGCLSYVHVAMNKRAKLDPKSRPCIFLRYSDDEFGYRLWNLVEKKVIQSRDIVFMEEKTIIDWEAEKKGSTSESTDRDRLDEAKIQPVVRRIQAEEQNGPTRFKQETELTKGVPDFKIKENLQSDSDEEPTKEPVAENQGWRYPLRERRAET